MRVISVQSGVASGHVGNAAASFVLQRLGIDVVRLDTVSFSNHPAHGSHTGGPVEAARLSALLDGIERRGLVARSDAVLSGYLGTAANGNVVADLVAWARRGRPDMVYWLDPVMGDRPQGLFVADDIPALIRDRLLPRASAVTPNTFELELLTGRHVLNVPTALAAARPLLRAGPSLVVVTGIPGGDTLTNLAVTADGAWSVASPRIEAPAYGAGDCFSAICLARWLEKRDPARAIALATASLHAILARTAATGSDELDLVGAQDAIPAPQRIFEVVRVE